MQPWRTTSPHQHVLDSVSDPADERAARSYLAGAYREERRELAVGVLAGTLWRGVGLAIPVVVGRALDDGVTGDNRAALWRWVGVIVLLAFADALLAMARHRHAAIPAARSAVEGRAAVLRTAHRADASLRRRFPPGDTLARATSDVDRVRQLMDFTPTSIGSALSLIIVLVLLFVTDPFLGLVICLPIMCAVSAIWMRSASSERRSRELQAVIGQSMSLAEASATSFKAICGLGAAPVLMARWRVSVESIRARALAVARLEARYQPVIELTAALTLIGALWVGGHRALDGKVSLGTVVTALGWAVYMTSPLQQIAQGTTMARRGRASAARLAQLHAAQPMVTEPAEPVRPDIAPNLGVVLRDVTVVRDGRTVLDGCSLSIAAGEVVAIVTATGGGKSTLGGLFDRKLDPDSGAVEVGGIDARSWPTAALHSTVRVVGRFEFVFGGSIRENVVFGRPDASDADSWEAIERAGASDVVAAKGGLEASVGVAGRALSGGQRQRLSLARAWLSAPAILVLDEATAAVDPRREGEILEAARGGGSTVVLLTSRASVAARADRVILIQDGRVAAVGTHAELAAQRMDYLELVDEHVDITA